MDLTDVTPREEQVLDLLIQGKTNKEIAAALGLSPNTIRNYLSPLRDKTGCKNRVDLAIWWKTQPKRPERKD